MGYFNCNDARFTREIKSRIVMEKAVLNRNKSLFASKLELNLRQKLPYIVWC
jgi:hypothetical protein